MQYKFGFTPKNFEEITVPPILPMLRPKLDTKLPQKAIETVCRKSPFLRKNTTKSSAPLSESPNTNARTDTQVCSVASKDVQKVKCFWSSGQAKSRDPEVTGGTSYHQPKITNLFDTKLNYGVEDNGSIREFPEGVKHESVNRVRVKVLDSINIDTLIHSDQRHLSTGKV